MNTNVTPRPTLNDMVKAAMAGAVDRVSITDEAVRQIGGTVKTASAQSTTDSLPTDLLNKLADALGFVADQLEKGAAVELPAPAGGQPAPGSGPGALHVMKAEHEGPAPLAPGQSGGKAEAGAPMESGKHGPAPANAMGTNESMHHGSWPADVMNGKTAALASSNLERLAKVGFAVTTAGHRYDARAARAHEGAVAERHEARRQYSKAEPKGQAVAHVAEIFGGIPTGVGIGSHVADTAAGRHAAYTARKHEAGKNAYNPFGGLATPSKGEKTSAVKEALLPAPSAGAMGKARGALAAAGHMPNLAGPKAAGGIVPMVRKLAADLKAKIAEDANNPAQISAGKEPGPAASGTASGESVPAQPADVNAQERLIDSNQAAINYTKRDAKRDPISDAGKVYASPVMKDPVLNQVFENSGKAGVKTSAANDAIKVAAARALLSKLAADVADKSKKSKESAMGAGSPPPPGVPSPAFTQ